MRAALVLLLVVPAILPAASAQLEVVESSLVVFIDDPGPTLFPGENETLVVHANYGWGQGAQAQPAPTLDRPENTTPTRITLAVKQLPSWVVRATLVPEVIEVSMEPRAEANFRRELTAQLILEIAPDAPAFQREDIVVTADAAPNGNIAGAHAESSPTQVKVQPVAKLNVTAAESFIIPGGRWTDVPFAVRNEGNDDVVVKLNVTLRPENSQVEFPTTLEIKRGETKLVDVRVRTPWKSAEFGGLELEATPIVEGQEGQVATAEVAVLGQSAVPGAGAPLAVALVALAAWLRRR